MAVECPLPTSLIVKETQAGVAGETGTVWSIAPDCSYTVARQIGQRELAPHKSGQLTAEQQAKLTELLAQVSDADLSRLADAPPHVNPRKITLSYGGRQAEVTLPAARGTSNLAAGKLAKPILDLSAAMKTMLGR